MRDAPIDRLIRKSLSAEVCGTSGHAADDNRISAYLESSLSADETRAFEEHVAQCIVCQQVMAAALKLQSAEEGNPVSMESRPSKKTLFHFAIPIPVVAALLLCIIAGALFFRLQDKTIEKAEPQEQAAAAHVPALEPSLQTVSSEKSGVPEPKDKAAATAPEKVLMAEAEVQSPPTVQSAVLHPNDEAGGIGVGSEVDRLDKKAAENRQPVVAGSVAPRPPRESGSAGAPLAGRDGLVAVSPAASTPPAGMLVAASTGTGSGFGEENKKGETENAVLNQSANANMPARTQEPFPRPPVYAAMNRIATTLYETESRESHLRFVIRSLDSKSKPAEMKTIGDRVFYKNLGYWIDKQCAENSGNPIVEVKSADPDFGLIIQKYPDMKKILPAIIHWEKRNCLLSK